MRHSLSRIGGRCVVGCSSGVLRLGQLAFIPIALAALLNGCTPISLEDAESTTPGGATRPAVDVVGYDNLDATLWAQSAAEYDAMAIQAYALAQSMLDVALADATWTAALEQTGSFSDLAPAVIVDLDETALDNFAYQARILLDGQEFSEETWQPWVMEQKARAVPGAVEFCNYAVDRGVTVFYVSNRRANLEAATRSNMQELGFPLDEELDTVLLHGERPEWSTSDKTTRRRAIADDYRILLSIGDNLMDFATPPDGTLAGRLAFAEAHRDYWGRRWIALPNPAYGSWLGSVLGFDYGLLPGAKRKVKLEGLDPQR